jgi:hypothetical protein
MEINQDLQDARSLLEQSGTEEEKRKYRRAAEIILLKALRHDPESKEAKILLQSARTTSGPIATAPPEPAQNELPLNSAAPELFKDLLPKKKLPLTFPIWLIVAVLVGGGLIWMRKSHPANRVTFAAPAQRIERDNQSHLQPALVRENVQETQTSDFSLPVLPAVAPVESSPPPVDPPKVPVRTPAVPPKPISPHVVSEPPRSVPKQEMGTLAVSSPIAADIYQNGQLIGSTPATLQLPAGHQTLEYRHGELHAVATHEIKPNETAAASVTFDISVQINAKPWARVFIDGSPRRPLGQTPLSGVNVPIGGTLVFENPNFPPKTHRITEKETAIQLNFP